MIIDLILNRQDGQPYTGKAFYTDVMEQYSIFPEIAGPIAEALDNGEEKDVKRELCRYIENGGYNGEIQKFINSNTWIL